MLRTLYISLLFLFLLSKSTAQTPKMLWENDDALNIASEIMDCYYHWNFKKADSLLVRYEVMMPKHPSLPLLKALEIYWENSPFDYQNDETVEKMFLHINRCITISESRISKNKSDKEATYFMLLAKSLKARAYNYRGATWKAVNEAKAVYNLTRKGMGYTEELPEFNFSSGIYNYYREFYPEKHPIYKPFLTFFPSGNKDLGVKQLVYSMKSSVFASAEAQKYLMWIYSHTNSQKSVTLAKDMISKYDDNEWLIFESLLVLSNYNMLSDSIINLEILKLSDSKNNFFSLSSKMLLGMKYYEMQDFSQSKKILLETEDKIDQISTRKTYLQPYIFSYLKSIYELEGNQELMKKYQKMASNTMYGDEIMARLYASRQ
ncbi:hypothetical protein MY04_3266 [Flammeovirga sp. MY04]|uniref:hypothetical protein n=1 Tax=Flammeovirga sp. MY04 TaxID=1191459 RepID=UPI00130528AB|nr:hypothetical protein [Flammeovirga sp. MY04]ANQ50628.2 hypothetical protein MY04_3266 [Flammeovirga sp. MY04]